MAAGLQQDGQWQRLLVMVLPLFLLHIMIVGSGFFSAWVVGVDNPTHWFFLGLFLPFGCGILGLVESARLCSLRAVHSHEAAAIPLMRLGLLALVFAVLLCLLAGILALVGGGYGLCHLVVNRGYQAFAISYVLANIMVSTNAIGNVTLASIGRHRLASGLSVVAAVMTLGLTAFFYHVLHWGIASLVVATALAYGVVMGLTWHILYRNRWLRQKAPSIIVHHDCLSSNWRYVRTVVMKTGVPVMLAYGALSLSLYGLNHVLAYFGETAVAGFGIAFQLQILLLLPAVALGIGTGQQLNRRRHQMHFQDWQLRYSMGLCLIVYIPIVLGVFYAASSLAVGLSHDVGIQRFLAHYLHDMAWAYGILGMALVVLMLWRYTGKRLLSLWVMGAMVLLQLAVAGAVGLYLHSLTAFFELSVATTLLSAVAVMGFHYLDQLEKRRCHDLRGKRLA